jgi:CheY-like chemotaxis protein
MLMADARILVVDDEADIRETVSEMLDLEGYAVETAANGEEALRAVERGHPDVVLLDMRMPVLDGWGFAGAVRARGMAVKIVVMTAARDAERWATEIAANGYLAKPFGFDDLVSTIEQVHAEP